MSTLPSVISVAPRLKKLIPLLGSDKEGEVVATVAAINRTLQHASLDLHDLADAIAASPIIVPPRPSPLPWRVIVAFCRARARLLNERERSFVSSIETAILFGHEPTPKQGAWLQALYARLWTQTGGRR